MMSYLRPTIHLSERPNPNASPESPAFLVQIESFKADYKGSVETQWLKLTEAAPGFFPVAITLDATPKEDLSPFSYINLDVGTSFHVPLSSTLKHAFFYNTKNNSFWDENDLPKLMNKSAAQALTAGLTSRIVLIGDSNQTFEYFGVRTSGPFVFRNPNRALQIINKNGVYEVIDMLLQLLDPSQTSSTEHVVYTQSATIAPKEKDIIIIDGPGNINLPQSPPNGFRFTIDDRKFRRLSSGRNAVIPATGERIGLGQSSSIVDHYQPVEWITEDAGSFSSWIYEASTKNWAVLLTRDNGGVLTQGAERPLLMTGNSPFTAAPYDRLYLNGNGDILISQLIQERQFIEISWQAGATWTVKVVCPIGFTFNGAYEDLEINTALTSVTRLQIVLKPGRDFGIGA